MDAAAIRDLDSAALARRLGELAGEERGVQVAFLLHLDEFDRRRAWAELGFPSLWEYLLRRLHLREGAAGRRIAAMRALRRFPRLEPALRDGRLCLSTAAALAPVLTETNVGEVVERAAFRTKAEVEHLAATLAPRPAPRDGLRKLPVRMGAVSATATPALTMTPTPASTSTPSGASMATATGTVPGDAPEPRAPGLDAVTATPSGRPPRVRLVPISEDAYSLRITIDPALKQDLDTLRALLGHKLPRADLAALVREAVRCAIEHHGRRRGAVSPAGRRTGEAVETPTRTSPPPSPSSPGSGPSRRAVPRHVRREVWARDGGRCTFVAEDGQRCGTRDRLELDHVHPHALGGGSTVANLRLRCRAHNLLEAERALGTEFMRRFTGAGGGRSST